MKSRGESIALRKIGNALHAIDDVAAEHLAKIGEGKDVLATVVKPRNIGQHRLFFAVLKRVIDSGAWEHPQKLLLEWVKIKCGHVTRIVVGNHVSYIPNSIDFASMDQVEFQEFFDRAIFHLCNALCGDDLRDEVVKMVEGPYKDAFR